MKMYKEDIEQQLEKFSCECDNPECAHRYGYSPWESVDMACGCGSDIVSLSYCDGVLTCRCVECEEIAAKYAIATRL